MWPTSQDLSSDSAFYYPIGTFQFQNGPLNTIPVLDFSSLPQDGPSNAMSLALSGGATMTSGGTVTLDASSCTSNNYGSPIPNVMLSPTSPVTTNGSPINVTVTNTAQSALGCIVNASDGVTTAPLQVYIGNFGVIVNRVKRK
jgi:hypothetical protein